MPSAVPDPSYQPPPGSAGNLTATQLQILQALKNELINERSFVAERMDDALLLRFLRARKFDLAEAKALLISAEQWRKVFGIEDIVKNFDFKEKEKVDKFYPQYYHKTDKNGRPIYIERLGQVDVTALYEVTTQERQLQRLVFEYERCATTRFPSCSRVYGHPVETSCTILDLGNVSMSSFWQVKDYVSKASSISQNRYPETMGVFYIINAPWAFSTIWSLVKAWLDPVTVAKMIILGSNYQDILLQQVPKECLPKEFGGTCECPGGCSLSDAGPWNSTIVDDQTPTS